jgi:hypothetical protein
MEVGFGILARHNVINTAIRAISIAFAIDGSCMDGARGARGI